MSRKAVAISQQFPLWHDDTRGLPYSFAASALFSVGGKHERRTFKQEVIASVPGVELKYTGEELRTDDQDVLMQLFHCSRGAVGDPNSKIEGINVQFSGHSFLVDLQWQRSAAGYTRLKNALTRLQNGSLTVVQMMDGRKLTFAGNIIRKFKIDESSANFRQQWQVWLEPEIVTMFKNFLMLNWQERTRLARPLSKWIHAFVSMQPDDKVFMVPEPMLMRLTGSAASTSRKFRQGLKEALGELVETGAIHDWQIDKGCVYIAKKPGIPIIKAALAAPSAVLPFPSQEDAIELEIEPS